MEPDIANPALNLSVESLQSSISVSRPFGTVFCLLTADVLAISLSMVAAAVARNLLIDTQVAPIANTIWAALILVIGSLTAAGLYPGVAVNPVEEIRRSFFAITIAFSALCSTTFFLHDLSQSRLVYVCGYSLAVGLVPLLRSVVRMMFATQSWWGSSVAIIGYGVTGKSVHETLIKNPGIGLKPVAVLDDDPRQYLHAPPQVTRGPLSRCLSITQAQRIPYAIVCMPNLSRHDLLHLLDLYGQCFGHLIVVPNLIGMTSLGICAREVGGIIGLEVTRQLLRPSARFAKRTLDLLFTLAIAPVVAPIVAIAALLIKIEGKGPIFYANERIGHGGRKFKAWKLRSMVTNGDEVLARYLQAHPSEAVTWHATQKLKHDPRLTRVGKIIRTSSIDELPQFWNVLIGEMSIVGPRPILERQVPLYGPGFELYKQVRPGITGLWQISGRNKLTFGERVKLDKYVIQNWSVWLDLYILARTASAVLTADGAY